MANNDCFAWDKKRKRCKSLKENLCEKGNCPFYKTISQYAKECAGKYPPAFTIADSPIIRIEDGRYYKNAEEAAKDVGLKGAEHLYACLLGDQKVCRRYHWRWAGIQEVR